MVPHPPPLSHPFFALKDNVKRGMPPVARSNDMTVLINKWGVGGGGYQPITP